MPFYQNPFSNDFIGTLVLSDRQYTMDFKVKANVNRSDLMVAYGTPPYNTVGNNTLSMNYSIDGGNSYYNLVATITSGAAVTVDQIVSDLNGDTNFSSLFKAFDQGQMLFIQNMAHKNRTVFRCYIDNTNAETVLLFNKKAGVTQMPSYFNRHTIANRNNFSNSVGMLVELSQPSMNYVITNAGLSTTTLADWQMMSGKSGLFNFQNITVDGSNRITQIIEYPAGANSGDMARLIQYVYTGANTNPNQITEIPYVMGSGGAGDFVTPP